MAKERNEGSSREEWDRPGFYWRHKTIMETGSEELKAVVTLITNGIPPGKPIKEDYNEQKN